MRPGDIVFHFDPPSLRVMLADAMYFAIRLFIAMACITALMTMIAMPIAIAVWILALIKQFISVCSL